MKLPADTQSFLRNSANKETLFNFLEVELKEGKKKLEIELYFFQM